MKQVRLRHPETGATYMAPESAVATLALSGWVRADEPAPEQAPETQRAPEAPGETEQKPRRRRENKED